jgi:two-component system, cell cycle sensor histidine kinase and response regulator CckA
LNARDAMPQGGRLTIDTRNVRVDVAQTQPGRHIPPGDYVMLSVRDTGTGMDAATRERLFEPFFTTKPVGKGTGLGLSTVHGIVEQSDGFIRVDSEPGAGATFTIYFPRVHDRPAPVASPAGGNGPRRPGDGEIVILVEDERAVRDLVRRFLDGAGYTVLSAANAADAIAMCDRLTAAPALLVTDVVMPGMTGPDLADTLRRAWPALRVLFLSGYTDEAILRNGTLSPGTHFQQKPFALDALVRKVANILDRDRSDEEQAS